MILSIPVGAEYAAPDGAFRFGWFGFYKYVAPTVLRSAWLSDGLAVAQAFDSPGDQIGHLQQPADGVWEQHQGPPHGGPGLAAQAAHRAHHKHREDAKCNHPEQPGAIHRDVATLLAEPGAERYQSAAAQDEDRTFQWICRANDHGNDAKRQQNARRQVL